MAGSLRAELQAEYILLQGFLEDYDKRALSLKALATPLLGAGIAAGLKEQSRILLAATMAVAVSLWLLEGLWKSFQHRHEDRIHWIEEWFALGGRDEWVAPFQIHRSWREAGLHYASDIGSWFRIAFAPWVMLPYALVFGIGLLSLPMVSAPSVPGAARVSQAETGHAPSQSIDDQRAAAGVGHDASQVSPPPAAGFPWAGVVVGLLGLGTAWLAIVLWRKRWGSDPGHDAGPRDAAAQSRLPTQISILGVLGAAASAWVAIGKVNGAWKLVLPALIAPLVTVVVVNWVSARLKWWALGTGLLASTAVAAAHLIDQGVRSEPRLWWSSLAQNLSGLVEGLAFTDYGAIFVALLAYSVALKGAMDAGSHR